MWMLNTPTKEKNKQNELPRIFFSLNFSTSPPPAFRRLLPFVDDVALDDDKDVVPLP